MPRTKARTALTASARQTAIDRAADTAASQIDTLLVSEIATDFNPRLIFDQDGDAGLLELAASIQENGLLQPITVRPSKQAPPAAPYILVSGERRLRAVRDVLKMVTITAVIRNDLDGARALEMTVIENLQRRDLHPMEEARGIAKLRADHGYTAQDIASKTGRSVEWVKTRLLLTTLPDATQHLYLTSTTGRLTLKIMLDLATLTAGGPDNKGFPDLIDALAAHIDKYMHPVDTLYGMLNGVATSHPHLIHEINHRGNYDGRWGGNYFDTERVCKKCPYGAYRRGYYDGIGFCLYPQHHTQLHAEGKAKYDAAQAEIQNRIATDPAFAAKHRKENPALHNQPEHKSTGQKAADTRKRHKDQQARFFPTMERIKNVIDMIPDVDSIDLAVICAYAMSHHNVGLDAINLVLKRQAIQGVSRTFLHPNEREIAALRKLTPLQLVKLTLEAILVTNAMRDRDYDPGRSPAEPVLKMYLQPANEIKTAETEE